jgi:multicomponent Na+:H+ antiporter subunit C
MMYIILVSACFAGGAWLLMQRQLLQGLLGVCVLGHAANMLIVLIGAGSSNAPAIIDGAELTISNAHADPLPQALVLTAIVIGFAIIAFGLALAAHSFGEQGTDDVDAMDQADSLKATRKIEAQAQAGDVA